MLIYRLKKIFSELGIDKPAKYLIKNGFSRTHAYKLSGKSVSNITLGQLEKLCILLRCTPNELIEWVPDKSDKTYEGLPLNKLRSKPPVNFINITEGIPYELLPELDRLIKTFKESVKKN